MIQNVHSVYNQPSVYNQGSSGGGGGGGGDGTFTIGTQTLYFPTYLQPVAYLDLSETTGKFDIGGAKQFYVDGMTTSKMVFKLPSSKMASTNCIFEMATPLGYNGAQTFKFSIEKGSTNITCRFSANDFYAVFTANNLQWETDIITVAFDASAKKVILTDQHGNSATGTSSTIVSFPQGRWAIFGLIATANNFTPKGQMNYLWTKNKNTNEITGLWVPARNKTGGNEPYIVECITGVVGCNYGTEFSTTGIAFGTDVTFEDIAAYFT